jgi:hypothetical protein
MDHKEKQLAIADEEGLITIHNIHSGGVLHSLPRLGSELSRLLFFKDNTNFWLAAVGWDGKMALVK